MAEHPEGCPCMNCGLARVRTPEPTTQAADLPPTQYLVMEVLAARARLGEELWPFPSILSVALRALEDAGLISVMHGNVPGSLRARLTEAGRKHSLRPGYAPPNGGIGLLRSALTEVAEFAEARAELAIGMDTIAAHARRALAKSDGGR